MIYHQEESLIHYLAVPLRPVTKPHWMKGPACNVASFQWSQQGVQACLGLLNYKNLAPFFFCATVPVHIPHLVPSTPVQNRAKPSIYCSCAASFSMESLWLQSCFFLQDLLALSCGQYLHYCGLKVLGIEISPLPPLLQLGS